MKMNGIWNQFLQGLYDEINSIKFDIYDTKTQEEMLLPFNRDDAKSINKKFCVLSYKKQFKQALSFESIFYVWGEESG